MKKNLVLSLTLLALLVAVGCGGSDETSSLTKAQFVKQGNSICEDARRRQLSGVKKFLGERPPNFKSTEASQRELVAEAGFPPIGAATEELSELEAPTGDESEVAAIVEGLEDALATTESELDQLTKESASPFTEVNELADEYGLTSCSGFL